MADRDDSILITDLLQKDHVDNTDVIIIEDEENTKKVTFNDMRLSMIEDSENPSNYRIYSSQKTKYMIDGVRTEVLNNIGGMDEDIQKLQTTAVTKTELSSTVEKLKNTTVSVDSYNNLVTDLENVRRKSDIITSSDLATGEDADKIHIENLGLDVISAMTGETAVTVPSVPVGGWVTEDISNKAITSAKLSKDFTFRGIYPDMDINRLVETGLYEVSASCPNVPHYGNDGDETRLLSVERFGQDGKWIIQRVYYKENTGENRPYFERKGQFARLASLSFIPRFDITKENKVTSSLLDKNYDNRGSVSEGSVYNLTESGCYYCESTVTDLPTTGTPYTVTVKNYSDKGTEYLARQFNINGYIAYISHTYKDSAGALQRTSWINISTMAKSKFDGKIVHIFGDSYSVGLGATNKLTTSYTSILQNKYGYRITNHALSDATMGNYGNISLTDRSILTQIDSTSSLYKNTDCYVIIFAGAEDYKTGAGPIGLVDSTKDTTFMGATNLAIQKILTKAPKSKILIVSPFYRSSTIPGDDLNGDTNLVNSKTLSYFSDALEEVTTAMHIPYLNLYRTCSVNKYNSSVYLSTNGVDLNDTGHALVAEKIHDAMCRYY